jgi:ribosome maturation factor RimP
MEKEIFQKYKGKYVKIGLKSNNFVLSGIITEVFEDCIEFRTKQKTSFLDFDAVESLIPKEEGI